MGEVDAAQGRGVKPVARLKQEPGGDLPIMGSGELVKSLLPHDLIDRLILITHPVALRRGERMFAEDGAHAPLRLVDSVTTTTGVIIATYELW